jgi:hypothetical protein
MTQEALPLDWRGRELAPRPLVARTLARAAA